MEMNKGGETEGDVRWRQWCDRRRSQRRRRKAAEMIDIPLPPPHVHQNPSKSLDRDVDLLPNSHICR